MALTKLRADNVGILSSGLCMIHCIATPFVFIASTCSNTCCESSPVWWQLFDFFFLAISFVAVHFAVKKTKLAWIRYGMYASFTLLLLLVLYNHLSFLAIPEEIIYVPAASLIFLHIYNIKHCNRSACECDTCH